MKKVLLAAVLSLGVAAPAFAGGCCDGVPAPVQRMLLNVSDEQQAPAQDAAAPAAVEQQPAPEAIAPAGGEATDAAPAPAAEGAPAAAPEATAPEAAPAEGQQAQ